MRRYNENLMRILIFTISTVLLILPFGVYASGTEEALPGPETVSGNTVSTNAAGPETVSAGSVRWNTVSEDRTGSDTVSGGGAGSGIISGNSVSSDASDGNTSIKDPESSASSEETETSESSPESTEESGAESSPESTEESGAESTGENGSETTKESTAGSKAESEPGDSAEKGPESDPGTVSDTPRETGTEIPKTEPDPEIVKEQKTEEDKKDEQETSSKETVSPETPVETPAPAPAEESSKPSSEESGKPSAGESPKPAEETPKPARQETVPDETKEKVIVEEPKAGTDVPEETAGGESGSAEEESKTKKEETESRKEDDLKPEIRIFGVEDRSANRKPLSITVTFQDEHLVKESARAYITATNSGKRMDGTRTGETKTSVTLTFSRITEDDYYVLTAGCRDESDNEETLKISFTENQKGPVTALKNVSLKDSEVNEKEVVPEFHVSGVDEITEVTADVNGRDVAVRFNKEGNLVLTEPLTKEGEYTVQVKTKDASGNEAHSDPVTFVIDRTKPKITMKKQKSGKDANGSFSVIISKDQKKDRFTEILLDGRKLEQDEYETQKDGSILLEIAGTGKHTVRATAKDAAGNTKTLSRTFAVKDTVRAKKGAGGFLIPGILAIAAGGAAAAVYFFRFRKRIR